MATVGNPFLFYSAVQPLDELGVYGCVCVCGWGGEVVTFLAQTPVLANYFGFAFFFVV